MSITRIMLVFFALCIVFISASCNADVNTSLPIKGIFKWVSTWGGTEDCYARKNAFDSNKNVYTAGYFKDIVDFNPDPTIDEIYTAVGGFDCYLIKFNKDGVFQWVKVWGGSEEEIVYDVTVDSRDNIILGGYFGNLSNSTAGYTVDFNPSDTKELNLTSNGKRDCYLCSFAPTGALRWATSWGGSERDEVEAVITDSSRNVFVGGIFADTVDLDPDPANSFEELSVGSNDVFLSKFDSSGNFETAQVWGGPKFDAVQKMVFDSKNNLIVGGIFQDTVDFNPDSVDVEEYTSLGVYDCWFSKFDSNLEYKWTRAWGGTLADWVYSVAVDSKNNVYISGYFTDVVDFNPDEVDVVNQTSNGDKDAFLSKFDENGAFIWVQTWGGTAEDKSGTVYLDGMDNIYVAREFGGGHIAPGYTVDFDPGFDPEIRETNGYQDCYFTKFDSDGNFVWVKSWGGAGKDIAYSMAVTREGIVYIAGVFSDVVDFNPDDDGDPQTLEDVEERTSQGGFDAFMIVFE